MLCSSRHQLNNSKLAKWLFLPIENLELHNFNLSAHKNRLGRTNGHCANLQNRGSWTNQHDLQRRPRSPTFPPISPPLPPPLYLEPLHGFAQSLKMDFFAHSLLISFPADTWISWQLLIWEQFSQIGKAWALLCTNSTKICLLSHEGRRKTARLDFLKMEFNFRNFETSSDLFSQYLGISLQVKDDRLTTASLKPGW